MVYQIYKIHLTNGTVIEAAEDYDLPSGRGLISKVKRASDCEWLTIGDPLKGYAYIPKESILFISTGDVREAEDHVVEALKLMEKVTFKRHK